MKLKFLGATETVTGSKFLLSNPEISLLIDCGLYQGYKNLRLRNWKPLPFTPGNLDGIILTHSHIDHSGFIPALVKKGYKRHIYSTEATARLCAVLLPDAGHLFEEDADYANRTGTSKHQPALPLYTEKDARESLKYFKSVPFYESKRLSEQLSFEFHPAGHILGAALVRINIGGRWITFTGDLGRDDSKLLPAPASFDFTDTLVIEATYGNRKHPAEKPEELIKNIIERTFKRGGNVLIPAFAVGRTQVVLQILSKLKRSGEFSELPVYMDSPMAIEATRIFREEGEFHLLSDNEFNDIIKEIGIARTPEESKRLDNLDKPAVIVSASGMGTGGRVVHHLKHMLPDPRNAVIFAGFQAAGTRGEALVNGAEEVKIHGEWVPVRAEISRLDSLSAHADSDGLLAWMKNFKQPPRQTFIVHGEPLSTEGLRRRIDRELGWKAIVPEYLSEYDV